MCLGLINRKGEMVMAKAKFVHLDLFAVAKAAKEFEQAIQDFVFPAWFKRWEAERKSIRTNEARENPFPADEVSHIFAQYLLLISDSGLFERWVKGHNAAMGGARDDFAISCDVEGYLKWCFDAMWATSGALWCSDAWQEGDFEQDPSWDHDEWMRLIQKEDPDA